LVLEELPRLIQKILHQQAQIYLQSKTRWLSHLVQHPQVLTITLIQVQMLR
jgi:hypothetical protein